MLCKICCALHKAAPISPSFRNFSRYHQTHYEVLNLPKTCTPKQIKSAFIRLSKEHHPDVNKSKQSHARFLQISAAYEVLGKAESRRNYDLGLSPNSQREVHYEPVMRNPYRDPLFWANRDRSRDEFYKDSPYYGIEGMQRMSNTTIVIFCIFFALVGLGLQFAAVSNSVTLRRDELIKKSIEAQNVLNKTKETALTNGNLVQLEALKVKLLGNTGDKDNK